MTAQLKLQIMVDDKGVHVIDQVGAKIQNFERQTSQSFGNLNSIWSKGLSLLGGFASVSGIGAAIKSVMDMADATAKMSQRLGISVEQLSEYRHIADLSGTSFETLAKGVQILSRNVFDTSQGTGEAREAFKALGINVKDTDGKLKDSNTVLLEVADKFSKVEDGTAKTALAMKIFGKSGAELIPMLNEGREKLAELGAETDKLGIKMSSEMAKAAEEVNDNLDRMKAAATGAAVQLTQALLPTLQSLTEELVKAAQGLAIFIGQTEKASLNRERMQVVEDLHEIERLAKEGPSWWDRLTSGSFGESGDLPENTLAERVYGNDAQWAEQKAKLETRLMEISQRLHELDSEAPPNKPSKTALILGPTDEEIKKAEAAADKWLSKYLDNVDARWKAEVDRNASLGELAVEAMKEQEADLKKREKLEEQSNKILYDMFEDRTKKQKQAAEKASDSIKTAITGWANSFSSSLNDALWGADFTFGNIAKSFAKMITQMIIQLQIIDPLLKKVFSLSESGGGFWEKLFQSLGGAGGTTSAGGAASSEWAWLATTKEASVMHGGGVIGQTASPRRLVPSLAFDFAPRLHKGLSPDEYPAILQRGETVIPKGGSGPMNVTVQIVNESGVDMKVTQSAATFDAQQMIVSAWLDALERNRFGLRDRLGG